MRPLGPRGLLCAFLTALIWVCTFLCVRDASTLNGSAFEVQGSGGTIDLQPNPAAPDRLPWVWDLEHGLSAGKTPLSAATSPAGVSRHQYRTAPSDLPSFAVERWPGELSEGYLFVSLFDNEAFAYPSYLFILDNEGEIIFYDAPAPLPVTADFKKQDNGLLTYFARTNDGNLFAAIDQHYLVVREYRAIGHPTDIHDLQLLDNGHALLLIHDIRLMDLSQVYPGGPEEAPVVGCIVQEIDQNDEVVFEWSSWDYLGEIELVDTNQPLDRTPLLYFHCNSVEEDQDGNLLLSSRHLDEVTKISRLTGDIIWRMGGRKNDFEFVNDTGFSYQHDARRLPNGRLTVYDNGLAHVPPRSRGVEYVVDEVNMTVRKTAEFRSVPDTYAISMGNMQTLPNGNRLVGWGFSSMPVLTEFDSQGNRLFELSTDPPFRSYRAFRFPWQGFPTWPAALAVEVEDGTAYLYFSWNGSTDTVSYKILAGHDPKRLSQLAAVAKDGFETSFAFHLPDDELWYFRIIPVNDQSVNGISSNLVAAATQGDTVYLAAVFAT